MIAAFIFSALAAHSVKSAATTFGTWKKKLKIPEILPLCLKRM